MENSVCPQCGSTLKSGMAVCGECGNELKESNEKENGSPREERRDRKNVYALLAIFFVVVGGVALLMFTGLLPNPIKGGGSTAAIVNGVKISAEEVDQKFEVYKKMSAQSGKMDTSSPAGKAAMKELRMQILNTLIQEKILVTEAEREKITVSQQEITEKIASIKKGMNLSDKDFEDFLKNHAMSLASFEKRMEKDALITKLIAKGTQEKGLSKDAWLDELNARAKVEILAK